MHGSTTRVYVPPPRLEFPIKRVSQDVSAAQCLRCLVSIRCHVLRNDCNGYRATDIVNVHTDSSRVTDGTDGVTREPARTQEEKHGHQIECRIICRTVCLCSPPSVKSRRGVRRGRGSFAPPSSHLPLEICTSPPCSHRHQPNSPPPPAQPRHPTTRPHTLPPPPPDRYPEIQPSSIPHNTMTQAPGLTATSKNYVVLH